MDHLPQVAQPLAPAEDNKDCLTRLIADMAANFPNMVGSLGFLNTTYFEEMQYRAAPAGKEANWL